MDVDTQQQQRPRKPHARRVWQPRRTDIPVGSLLFPPPESPETTALGLPPSQIASPPSDSAQINVAEDGAGVTAFESPSRLLPRRPSGKTRWQRRSAHSAKDVPPSDTVSRHLNSQETVTAKNDVIEAAPLEFGSQQQSDSRVASPSFLVSNVDSREEGRRDSGSEASLQKNYPKKASERCRWHRRSKASAMGGKPPETSSQDFTASVDFSEEGMTDATPLDVTSQHLEPVENETFVDSSGEDEHLRLQRSSLSAYCREGVDRFQLHPEENPAMGSQDLGCLENAVSEAVPSEVISQHLKSPDIFHAFNDPLNLQETTSLSIDFSEGAKAAVEHNSCKIQSCEGETDGIVSEDLDLTVTESIESVKESVPANQLLESNVVSPDEGGGKETAAHQLSESEKYTAFVKVDAPFLKFVTGKRGETVQRIENETTTKICVPCLHEVKKRGASIVIKGQSQEKVDEAVSKLQDVFHEAEESSTLGYSHFISLPLALHPTLKEQIIKFHESVFSLVAGKKMQPSGACRSLDNTNKETEITDLVSGADEVVDASEEADPIAGAYEVVDASEEVDPIAGADELVDASEEADPIAGADELVDASEEADPIEIIRADDTERKAEEETIIFNEDEIEEDSKIYLTISSSGAIETNEHPINSTGSTMEVHDDKKLPSKLKGDYGIEESIFIKPTRVHLTVLMLKLWNEERVATAAEVLQSVRLRLLDCLDHRPIFVRLKGLECMKGSPKKAHVLYANVEETDKQNRLTQACNIIRDAFVEAGLVSQKGQNQELKLHATLMNTMHRTRKKGKRHSKRIPFDAREILLKHGSEDWGEYMIVEAHLSERFAYGEDDYYHCCGCIQFPSAISS